MTHKLEATEESIPAFQRAGTILTRKDRFRRSSTQMVNDPFTLVSICADSVIIANLFECPVSLGAYFFVFILLGLGLLGLCSNLFLSYMLP